MYGKPFCVLRLDVLSIKIILKISKQYYVPGSISAAPENITVTFLNPTSVKVSWQTSVDQLTPIEKYDVTYKPTDARYVYGFRMPFV